MTDELFALVDNYEVGRIYRDRKGKLSFVYNEDWREDPNAYPISLSMPLATKEHGHEKIDSFLWGLLPDNQRIVESWARRFHVSAGSSFKLIAHVGEDCAGAIQFVKPERLHDVLEGVPSEIAWLDEHDIAERLKRLVMDHAAWRIERDTGQFSLAGAQPKTAFLFENGRWGVPAGRIPTTHIFKPPLPDYEGHAENEHFCLQIAAKLGLLVTSSQVMRFEDQIAIVVERYDRLQNEGRIRRVHQEDMCQALGLRPGMKYQADGGPGANEVLKLLGSYSISPIEDKSMFVNALALNWLVGGSDAHAKNYSVLIGSGGEVRLAPLYDIASALLYDHIDQSRATLAMKIGGKYRLQEIRSREWRKFASEQNLNADELIERLRNFAEAMPDYVIETQQKLIVEGLTRELVERLTNRLLGRAKQCREILELSTAKAN